MKKSSVKKTLILGDSEIKNVDGWRLNRRMKSIVSVHSISGATTKAMKHNVMGCLEDESSDTILLETILEVKTVEKIASSIINVAVSAKNKKKYVSGLTVRNDTYDRKGKEVTVILKKKCDDKNLSFIDNGNINHVC